MTGRVAKVAASDTDQASPSQRTGFFLQTDQSSLASSQFFQGRIHTGERKARPQTARKES